MDWADVNQWGSIFGHLGYRAVDLQPDMSTMIPDRRALRLYTDQRMWWMMRPRIVLGALNVHGAVIPRGEVFARFMSGYNSHEFGDTLLTGSTIRYDANEESCTSEVELTIWPAVQ